MRAQGMTTVSPAVSAPHDQPSAVPKLPVILPLAFICIYGRHGLAPTMPVWCQQNAGSASSSPHAGPDSHGIQLFRERFPACACPRSKTIEFPGLKIVKLALLQA